VLLSATSHHQAGSVTVGFEIPTSNGDLPIIEYRARCREVAGAEVVGVASPLAFAEGVLPRGQDLTFVVVAVSGVGEGPASAPSPPTRLIEADPRQIRDALEAARAAQAADPQVRELEDWLAREEDQGEQGAREVGGG
jgi:hypothetical protein